MLRCRAITILACAVGVGMLAGAWLTARLPGGLAVPAAAAPGPMADPELPGPRMPTMRMPPPMGASGAIAATPEFVYVLRGNMLYQFSARGLRPMGRTSLDAEPVPTMGARPVPTPQRRTPPSLESAEPGHR